MLAAVGGTNDQVHCPFLVDRNTCKESVRQFFAKLFHESPFSIDRIIVVCDNHRSHHSTYVLDYLAFKNVNVLFLPPYSSQLNNCEFVW